MVLKDIAELSDDPPPRESAGEQSAKPKGKCKAKAKAKGTSSKQLEAERGSPRKAKAKAKAKAASKQLEPEKGSSSKGLVLKRPAAASAAMSMKRPAASKRPLAANKYMYTTQSRMGIWGIKTGNKEVVRAGLMCDVNPSVKVKPAPGVSQEKIEEIAASWFDVVAASVRQLRKRPGWRSSRRSRLRRFKTWWRLELLLD